MRHINQDKQGKRGPVNMGTVSADHTVRKGRVLTPSENRAEGCPGLEAALEKSILPPKWNTNGKQAGLFKYLSRVRTKHTLILLTVLGLLAVSFVGCSTGDPQLLQNLAPSGTSASQLGHLNNTTPRSFLCQINV